MRRLRLVPMVTMVVLVASVAASAAWAWTSGYRIYSVRTGSMEPTIHPGDAVLVRADDSLPAVGDVITFRPSPSAGLVTHRVVAVEDGRVHTKGDANETDDTWVLDTSMVVGAVQVRLPAIGYVLVFLRQPTGLPAIALLVVAIATLWRLCFPLPEGRRASSHMPHLHDPDLASLWTELTEALEHAAHAIGRHHGVATGDAPPAVVPPAVVPPRSSATLAWSEGTLLDLELLCAQLGPR